MGPREPVRPVFLVASSREVASAFCRQQAVKPHDVRIVTCREHLMGLIGTNVRILVLSYPDSDVRAHVELLRREGAEVVEVGP